MWRWIRERLAALLGLRLEHSQNRYFRLLESLVTPGLRWLEIGSGQQIVPPWSVPLERQSEVVSRAALFCGIDVSSNVLEHPLLEFRTIASCESMPFEDESFELVSANMVMEHIANPGKALAEIRRILRPGGRFIFHTPNYKYFYTFVASFFGDSFKRRMIWLLERRQEQHVFPTFYRMNTTTQVRRLADQAGLFVERMEIGGSVGLFTLIGPLSVLELFFLRLLTLKPFRGYDATLTAVLVKPHP